MFLDEASKSYCSELAMKIFQIQGYFFSRNTECVILSLENTKLSTPWKSDKMRHISKLRIRKPKVNLSPPFMLHWCFWKERALL